MRYNFANRSRWAQEGCIGIVEETNFSFSSLVVIWNMAFQILWDFLILLWLLDLAGWTSRWLDILTLARLHDFAGLLDLLDFLTLLDVLTLLDFLTFLGLLGNWCNTLKLYCLYTPIRNFQLPNFEFAKFKFHKFWICKIQISQILNLQNSIFTNSRV